MKRRTFLTSSLLASSLAVSTPVSKLAAAVEGKEQVKPEYYELRLYHLRRAGQPKLVDDFLRGVALPAMKRNGVGPIGVFNVMIGPDTPTIYMLIPYSSPESLVTLPTRLMADAEYQKAGAEFINVPATDPAYVRMESSFMVAFEGFPKMEVPTAATGNKPRIFELRTYESHSEKAHRKKIEMFSTAGEIAIFRRTGLQPVFFGDTLIGPKLPNLTYMLTFENMAARDKNWATFGGDPEWKKLSTTPGYTDAETVSNISSVFLRPTAYSQI